MGTFGAGASTLGRIVTGFGAGAGSSVVQDVAATAAGSNQGIDPERAAVSGLVGSVVSPLLPRAPTGLAPRQLTPGREAVMAGERIGVPIPRAMSTESVPLQQMGAVSRGLPFGSPIEGAAARTTAALGEAAERTAQGFGAGGDPLHAGDAARQGILAWIRGGSAAVDRRVYGEVERLINRGNPNATAPLAETRVEAMALLREMQESTGTASQGAIRLVQDAIARPQGLTWQGAQRLRTEIGARLSGDILPEAGTSMPALQRLYGALTIDMGRIADAAGGPAAVAAWHRADRIHRLIVERRQDLARIIGTEGQVAPEQVFERLIAMARAGGRADINRLAQARRAMGPDAWNEVASAVIQRMGRDASGEFSPARWLTEYGRITNNGRNLLFGSTQQGQGLRQALDDIATVSQRFQDTMQKYANPSGTGRAVGTMGAITGAVTAPLHALAIGLGGYGLASLLARPASARAVARWAAAYTQAATRPGQAGAILLEQATRQLFEVMQENGIEPERPAQALPQQRTGQAEIGSGRTAVQPAAQPDLNVIYDAMLSKGVHPRNAVRAIGNPDLAIKMLREPHLYRDPTTPAEQKLAERAEQHPYDGGIYATATA
jgi:hypothetical protein